MKGKAPKGKTGFISKLNAILSNPQLSSVVVWSCSGNSFLILEAFAFELEVLGDYFRHKRMSSFVRQLNMYGFHKQRSEKEALEFYHPCFQRDRPDLFPLIERKKASELSFKENQPENCSKESQSQHFFSAQCMPSIKVIEPESEYNYQPSFKFTCSKMTIRLNEALTSLREVELDQEIPQNSQIDSTHTEPLKEGQYQYENNGEFQNTFLPEDLQEKQINLV